MRRGDFSLGFARVAGTVVVTVQGELDAYTAPELHQRLAEVVDDPANVAFVVDLAETTFVSSAGVRVLVQALGRARDKGSALQLRSPSPATWKVLDVCGLTGTFTFIEAVPAR